MISYSGLATLAVRCNDALKPGTTAYDFRRWVTTDVLVAIFDTGRYESPVTVAPAAPPAALPGVAPEPAGKAVDGAPEPLPAAGDLSAHHYTAADPLFMACIALTEKRVVRESECDEWTSTWTFRPSNDMLMRNAKALAYLLRSVPRKAAGWPYTQYELADDIGLTACHLREAMGNLEALEFVAVKRIRKGKPGPTFELRMLWENIEAAADRDGVELAGLLAGAVQPKALAPG